MKKMKSLKSNKVQKSGKTLEGQLTSAQKKTWKNIKQGFVELKLADEGKLELRPKQELIDEL